MVLSNKYDNVFNVSKFIKVKFIKANFTYESMYANLAQKDH